MKIFSDSLQCRQPMATSLLQTAVAQGKLAHAYLLTGRAIDQKWEIASSLACYLNCQSDRRTVAGSCGRDIIGNLNPASADSPEKAKGSPAVPALNLPASTCQNCRWILGDAHPQAWLTLSGDETKSGMIPVEKARALSQELGKTSQFVRVIIVPGASQEIFHRPAANALLKTIEDPGSICLFLLFATQLEDVLPTIVSRCQVIPLLNNVRPDRTSPGHTDTGKVEMAPGASQPGTGSVGSNLDLSSVSGATSSLSSTLDWAQHLEEQVAGDADPAHLIDQVVGQEIDRLKASAADNPEISWYLSRLLALSETFQSQLEHHVPLKGAIESFVLGCHRICHGRLEEAGLGKSSRL